MYSLYLCVHLLTHSETCLLKYFFLFGYFVMAYQYSPISLRKYVVILLQ